MNIIKFKNLVKEYYVRILAFYNNMSKTAKVYLS